MRITYVEYLARCLAHSSHSLDNALLKNIMKIKSEFLCIFGE